MTDSSQLEASVHTEARRFTDPLFAHDFFLATGRNTETACATATFVRFEGVVYAVTCRHVLDDMALAAPGARLPTLAFGVDAASINMANFDRSSTASPAPLRSLFASPRHLATERPVDIAIARLGSAWDLLAERKRKTAIDLDCWREPDWSDIGTCAAVGYLTEHKSQTPDSIVTRMAVSTVGLASKLTADSTTFRLHSSLPQPHGYWMSGMSGGPILALHSPSTYSVIGIVFEGGPSSPTAVPGLATQPTDLFYGGHVLTPATFRDWVERTDLPDLEHYLVISTH